MKTLKDIHKINKRKKCVICGRNHYANNCEIFKSLGYTCSFTRPNIGTPLNLPETNVAHAAALCSLQQSQTTTNNSDDIPASNSTPNEGKSIITSLSKTMKQQRLVASASPVPSCTHIIDSLQGKHSNIKENNAMGHPFDANFVFLHTLVSVSVLDSNDNTCNAKKIRENMQKEKSSRRHT